MIELRTLGSLELTSPRTGDVSAPLTQPKRLALLVYLSVARPRGFHRRDTLLALFWPEFDTQHATGALSQALSHLRVILGSGVVESRGRSEVRVAPSRLLCDAVAFEDYAAAASAERALALYRGDFLQGLHVPASIDLERWMEDERNRLRDLATGLAWTLAEVAEGSGDAGAAAHWARRAAGFKVNDEIAVRRQIALLDRVGDRAGALAVYDDFARRFEADFGVPPSAETQACIQQLRSARGVALTSGAMSPNATTRHAVALSGPERVRVAPNGATSAAASSVATDHPNSTDHPKVRTTLPRFGAWSVGAVLGVVAGVLGAQWLRGDAPRPVPSWFELAVPDSAAPLGDFGIPGSLALSPDGSTLAYVGDSTSSLFLRTLDELSLRRIPGTEGASCPSFSPDGRWILFTSSSRLWRVAIRGGAPITIADSAATCGVWTDANEIVFDGPEHLYRVSADGGPVSLLTRRDSINRIGAMVPSHALPGRKAALICLSEDVMAKWQLAVVSIPSGQITRLTDRGYPSCPVRFAGGHLVFARKRAIVAAPFSLGALRITGPEVVLLRDTMASFSTSGNGALAYIAATPRTHSLVAVSENGSTRTLGGDSTARPLAQSPLTALDTGRYSWPRISPDGRRVVMEMLNAAQGVPPAGLWVYDVPSRTTSKLTEELVGIQPLGWSSDSRDVIFTQIDSGDIAGKRRIVIKPWDASTPAREFIAFPERFSRSIYTLFDITIGPPHGYAAFVVWNFSDTADIWIAPVDTPAAARPLVASKAREAQPRLSPDGKLLAYISNETGRNEVYVRSMHGPARRVQVSTHGGWQPLWSPDAARAKAGTRTLFYRAPEWMMRATLTSGDELGVVRRDTLFRDIFVQHDVVNYDVFPDGKHLLMVRPNPRPRAHVGVVLNWPVLLRRRAPAP